MNIRNSIFFIVILFYTLSCTGVDKNSEVDQKINSALPIYCNKNFSANIDQDTIYHTIPEWSFFNQDSELISSADYLGKIYVVDFFFTTCPTICPKMTANMVFLQSISKDLDVDFLSFTVDPKKDSSETLKKYQQEYGALDHNWNFITGEQYKIYDLGVNGFLVPNQEDALAPGGFLHSEKMILIDAKGRIRGMYNGTTKSEMNKIVADINKLKNE